MLMLSYIESECQSLGAADSARHVAMAAALLRDESGSTEEAAGWPARFGTPQGHA
ncbi:hypothetical protein HMPREF9946_00220 [Acetobacteraceae bacterium AT-5844]|nr:hypothetical protein HMPREF9946_00220 [Acetobacteraceae bacterium AT-5844]